MIASRLVLCALAAAVIATPAAAQSPVGGMEGQPAPERRWIKKPVWVRVPTEDEIMLNYPPLAVPAHASGSALLVCRVDAEGALEQCVAGPEAGMPHLRFDEGALKVAKLMRMAPFTTEGKPTAGGYVAVPIVFQFPLTPFEAEVLACPGETLRVGPQSACPRK